jgi:TonB family protein
MSNRSRASRVDGHPVRGLLALLICTAITATVAAAWVMRRTTPHQARPAALAVTPPRGTSGAPRALVPTAEEEGDRIVSRVRGLPAGGRLRPSPRDAQPGAPATKRPHPPVPKQTSRPQTAASGLVGTARPADPARQLDPAQGQAATGQVPAPGVDQEGAGSGTGVVSSAGSPPSPGEGDRAAGATGPLVPSIAEPVRLVPPRVITSAGTDYPVEAFRLAVTRQELGSNLVIQGTEGSVRVRALVRADGVPDAVEVTASSGSAILDRAAAEAVRRWVFAPATRNGVPVDAYVTFTIRYVVR